MKIKTQPHEIYTALMVIKTVCEESADCCLCPLKSQNPNFACGLVIKPVNWKIKDYNEYNAFK
jgi:hypothetical protein